MLYQREYSPRERTLDIIKNFLQVPGKSLLTVPTLQDFILCFSFFPVLNSFHQSSCPCPIVEYGGTVSITSLSIHRSLEYEGPNSNLADFGPINGGSLSFLTWKGICSLWENLCAMGGDSLKYSKKHILLFPGLHFPVSLSGRYVHATILFCEI